MGINTGRLLVLLGAVAFIFGTLMPWITAMTLFGQWSLAGYQGYGIITGGIGVLLLLGSLLAKGKPGRLYSIGSAIFALIGGVATVLGWTRFTALMVRFEIEAIANAQVGAGVYVTLLGALLAFVGGVLRVPEEPASPPLAPEEE